MQLFLLLCSSNKTSFLYWQDKELLPKWTFCYVLEIFNWDMCQRHPFTGRTVTELWRCNVYNVPRGESLHSCKELTQSLHIIAFLGAVKRSWKHFYHTEMYQQDFLLLLISNKAMSTKSFHEAADSVYLRAGSMQTQDKGFWAKQNSLYTDVFYFNDKKSMLYSNASLVLLFTSWTLENTINVKTVIRFFKSTV